MALCVKVYWPDQAEASYPIAGGLDQHTANLIQAAGNQLLQRVKVKATCRVEEEYARENKSTPPAANAQDESPYLKWWER